MHTSELARLLYKCAAFWRAPSGASERPLGRREFLQGSGSLSGCNISKAVESDVKNKSLPPCTGLGIRGCQEPKAPLNSPAAPSNISREPKDAMVPTRNTIG